MSIYMKYPYTYTHHLYIEKRGILLTLFVVLHVSNYNFLTVQIPLRLPVTQKEFLSVRVV